MCYNVLNFYAKNLVHVVHFQVRTALEVLLKINPLYKDMSLDTDALDNLPENGPLPGTVLQTVDKTTQANQTETTDGPSVSELSDDTDFVRPSVLTLGNDRRSDLERLAAAANGEHHTHVRLGKVVQMFKDQHWPVSCRNDYFKRES